MLQPKGILQIMVLESGTSRGKARFADSLCVEEPWDEAFVKNEKTAPRCVVVTPKQIKEVRPAVKAC